MAKVWTADDGPEGQQIMVQASALGSVRMVLVDIGNGSLLPPGDFEGQLAWWNGSAWVPVPAGGSTPKVDGFTSIDPSPTQILLGVGAAQLVGERAQMNDNLGNVVALVEAARFFLSWSDGVAPGPLAAITGDGTGILATAGADALASLTLSEAMVVLSNQTTGGQASINADDSVTVSAANTVTAQAATVEVINPAGAFYRATANEHRFTTLDGASAEVENLRLSNVADAAALGVLGAAPVVRQSVTGETQQAQIDSVVSALSAFGFTQDDRPAAPSLQSQIGWAPNAAGQTSNVLTVLAAGHTPGLYLVAPHVMVRTQQAGSYLSMAATWSNAGAQSLTPTGGGAGAALSITSAGMALNNGTTSIPRTPFCLPIYSDGVSAITVQFTAAGTMAGAALLDVYVAATCLGT